MEAESSGWVLPLLGAVSTSCAPASGAQPPFTQFDKSPFIKITMYFKDFTRCIILENMITRSAHMYIKTTNNVNSAPTSSACTHMSEHTFPEQLCAVPGGV